MIDGKAMKYFPKSFIVFQGPNDDFKTSKCFNTFHLDELFDFKIDFFDFTWLVYTGLVNNGGSQTLFPKNTKSSNLGKIR